MEGWEPTVTRATLVEIHAGRSAGPAAPGALGVSFGAAGEFVRRQRALQQERRGTPEVGQGVTAGG